MNIIPIFIWAPKVAVIISPFKQCNNQTSHKRSQSFIFPGSFYVSYAGTPRTTHGSCVTINRVCSPHGTGTGSSSSAPPVLPRRRTSYGAAEQTKNRKKTIDKVHDSLSISAINLNHCKLWRLIAIQLLTFRKIQKN